MYINSFLDRKNELSRLSNALRRTNTQFVVIYGRRRIGKSTLIKKALRDVEGSIYFLADRTSESQQRWLFARTVSEVVPYFDKAVYSDWESLLRALNQQVPHRLTICLDEFPYLVKSCASLPSVIQKLLNERALRFDLIICGSSQQLMQGYVLDKKEPLYGLADEIMRITPIPAYYTSEALKCTAQEAVEEYAVWGGVPRYWELRMDYPTLTDAIKNLLLDTNGILTEEPQRLLRDDMRDIIQTETLLSIVGSGANKMSEIAARADKTASQLTDAFSRLREMGYIERETPFGEDEKKSKKGIYRITDPLFRFLYRYVIPYRSVLELGRTDMVMKIIDSTMPQYVGECWERLCRQYVSGNMVGDVLYNKAGRWWGMTFADGDKVGEMVELDVVAESMDKKHILIGECKWTGGEDAARLMVRLERIAPHLPFVRKGQKVHYALFLKQEPRNAEGAAEGMVFVPTDVLTL